VVIGGGDGTINAAAAGILETKLPLGIIPLGTANDLARTLGIPPRVEDAAAIIVAGDRRRIDLGMANDAHFFNVASLGLSARIARTLRGRDKRRWGVFGYAIAAAKVAVRVRPFRAELVHDGATLTVRTVQIAVGNGRYYGGGMAIAADASPEDGLLDAYSLEVSGWPRLLALLPALRRGALDPPPDVRTIRTRALAVATRRPQPVDLDGDIGTMTPVKFTLLPGAIEVYAPAI
jgi:YegS/Rv2252/BmrU family lipid kinase